MRLQNNYILLISGLVVVFNGCLNKYERDVIGFYKVGQYELIDSTKVSTFSFPSLTIKEDKTFLLSFKDKNITGKWEADDNGDNTLAYFYINGDDVQALVGMESLKIVNPWQFECPFLKTLEFKKIESNNPNP